MRRVLQVASALFVAGAMAATEKTLDLASVIDAAAAQKILGEAVKKPTPLNSAASDGYHSKCIYFGSKSARSLSLRLRQAAEGSLSAADEFDEVVQQGGESKPIKNLGERAAYLEGSDQNGLPPHAVMLYVVKGNAFITVGVSGLADGALEKAKTVARKILTKL
ncbi:MAG: hypothetical protein M3R59_06370 [Verrucomicrobiota bacterium]|nr:hypothetical protein [Verrucomicrobiota bacterium]